MKPSTSFEQRIYNCFQQLDDFGARLAKWLNRKAVAIPLRVLRLIFMIYATISVIIFTAILYYGDDLLQPPAGQFQFEHPATTHKQSRAPLPTMNNDSLLKIINHSK